MKEKYESINNEKYNMLRLSDQNMLLTSNSSLYRTGNFLRCSQIFRKSLSSKGPSITVGTIKADSSETKKKY